ncbi:hypothetical protein PGTUg99_009411 [Puccinia graminis f. sp. tritici]|uniref:Caprin-1 dimerization domain-containing protein n=2 Tax=Puccinia graminis f. sp. tritici TaxID=56615 RepID=E3JVK3_PUCGT|nr:uncharacterized protein PGTG_02519 [Puccinia graminis f. sp. tritici CRL 75-36-700-3]EFP76078.1 hypothetical protein PGTG_02519 [Puccinia graminis f. sp. tritici CRL 75-36-700-3]KAA1127789.1 hypothetical protein PGTUg99_009411 [Puccinia graminis f. sp. tritici]
MAGPTTTDQPVPPTSTTNTTRVIPGLSSQPPNNPASKRSRKKKTGSKVDDTTKAVAPVPAIVDEPNELTEPAPAPVIASVPEPLNGLTPSAPPASASVSISPVQQVQKRIRAATKKLQRIGGYESSTVPLNEDQKRAIASKPALEATVKELQDLLKILEEDEKLDELRIQAVREEEELKVQGRVDSAVLSEQKKAESNLTFLLQFLHLYSLVNSATRPTDSFAPPIVSPVIQNATAQELAAVNALFHRLADGPIAGGDGDAFDSINRFTQGHTGDVIEGVSFAKVKEMVIQLTASPAELAPVAQIPPSNQDQLKVEEEVAPVNSSAPLGNMMFLQQSEVLPPVGSTAGEDQTPAAVPDPSPPTSHPVPIVEKEPIIDHVARNKQLLEQATIVTPEHLPSSMKDWTAGEQSQPSVQLQAAPAASQDWNTAPEHLSATQAEVVARTIDWAEDVQGQGEGQPNHLATNFTPAPPPPPPQSHLPGDLGSGQLPLGPPHHHMNNPRGHFRGRGGYRGGPGMPRGGANHDGYRGGRGWYRGNPGGYRGGREGPPPMEMNGWRPGPGGPPEANGGYRPRADYPGGRYGGHRGGPRGGNAFHRPPPPPSQVYHPEVAAGPGGNMY